MIMTTLWTVSRIHWSQSNNNNNNNSEFPNIPTVVEIHFLPKQPIEPFDHGHL